MTDLVIPGFPRAHSDEEFFTIDSVTFEDGYGGMVTRSEANELRDVLGPLPWLVGAKETDFIIVIVQ